MRHQIRWATLASLFCFGVTLARSEIVYTLTPDPAKSQLHVNIAVETTNDPRFDLEIPAWAPGAYSLNRAAENVSDVAVQIKGTGMISVYSRGRGKWNVISRVPGTVNVSYTLPMNVVAGAAHFSGPATYMYVVGRKREACRLIVNAPEKWNVVTGLDASQGGKFVFTAPNYDTLADNPITAGDFILDSYRVAGKPHYICLYGAGKNTVDRPYLKQICSSISSMETDFFGGAPYNKYIWHFRVNEAADGGGGLEHLSSTEISMASGLGPGVVGVMAHEFFHLWNVKRIRSKALGPFDYTQLPQTGALWWLEGVTDYYAYNLMRRYGIWDDKLYFEELANEARTLRSNPNRFINSPYDSSFRVREAANGRGNSQGLGISYYLAGHQLGFIYDVEMLSLTKGKYSLDDVEKALWVMCKDNQPGFEEGEIRRELVKFGGEEMGELYDKTATAAVELPLESALAKIGYRLIEKDLTTVRPAFTVNARAAKKGLVVATVRDTEKDLKADDVIVKANATSLEFATTHEIYEAWKRATSDAKESTPIKVTVKRTVDGKESTLSFDVRYRATTAKRLVIEELPSPSSDQLALRKLFLAAHRR